LYVPLLRHVGSVRRDAGDIPTDCHHSFTTLEPLYVDMDL
jgi:hypothetical protein